MFRNLAAGASATEIYLGLAGTPDWHTLARHMWCESSVVIR